MAKKPTTAQKKTSTKKKTVAKKKERQPLTGKELLKKLKAIPDLSRTEKARECGYETTKGKTSRVNLSQFMNAVIEAKGISLEPERKDGRGREASYRVKVQKNGQILVGATYTERMGLQTGDEFEIKVGRKQIRLTQILE